MIKWLFPENNGGRDSGFHDAGVETFKGNLERYLARELIQNSLDARLDQAKPVHVKFELLKLPRGHIPDMENLQKTFERCRDYWVNSKKAYSFFEHAAKIAANPNLKALKISDQNTNGVPGQDNDRESNWYHLLRSAGSSSKGGGEGGSFGIGKNAPFAASEMRTVFYSRKTADDAVAFQGVSTLVSHELSVGVVAQPIGFLGGERGASIRTPQDIPPVFRRKDCGLDIIVLEYAADPSWQDDLIYSVLENFWPALDLGDLVVTVGNKKINKSNLRTLLETFSSHEGFTAHQYYRSYKFPAYKFERNLPNLGPIKLCLVEDEARLPKKIAMVRKTGMVIYPHPFPRTPLPFCGVFMCLNEAGNAILRDMEPPRHDTWDQDHPDKGANKKIYNEFVGYIRECLKSLVPTDEATVIAVPGLSRFLPDDDETEEDSFDGHEDSSAVETAERSPLPENIPGRRIDPNRHKLQAANARDEGDQEHSEFGAGEETGGAKESTSTTADGDGSGKAGSEEKAGTQPEGTGSSSPKPAVSIRYRTFAKVADPGKYCMVITSLQAGEKLVNIFVNTVGDDQKAPAEIQSACLTEDTRIPIAGPGILGPIALNKDCTLRIEMTLAQAMRVAMEVSAHEA